jgi:nicotinate phosphoribosyltransferase
MTGALATDLCELNMAASYLRRGMVEPATFSLFVRNLPTSRGVPDCHGLEDCLTFLERFHFDEDERARLGDTLGFTNPPSTRFAGCASRLRCGQSRRVGSYSRASRCWGVTAPTAEAQLVETVLPNQLAEKATAPGPQAGCFGPGRPPRSRRPA